MLAGSMFSMLHGSRNLVIYTLFVAADEAAYIDGGNPDELIGLWTTYKFVPALPVIGTFGP